MSIRRRKKQNTNLINLLNPNLENLLLPIISLAEDIEPTEFKTGELKMKEEIERQFDNENVEEYFISTLFPLLSKIDLTSFAKELKKNHKRNILDHHERDNRFTALYALVNEVEKVVPNAALLVFLRNNPMEEMAKAMEPLDLIQDFEKLNGEKAARCAIRIFREVAEMVYTNYCKAIYEFVQLSKGKKIIISNQSFGDIINLITKYSKEKTSSLITDDAAWLRNATCHGHWRYDAEKDILILWDEKRPKKEFTANQLFELAMEMYTMVIENYIPLFTYYIKEKFLGDWFITFKYILKNFQKFIDEDTKIEKEVSERIDSTFQHIGELEFKREKYKN